MRRSSQRSRQIRKEKKRKRIRTCNDDALPIELGKTFEKAAGDFVKATYEVRLARNDESVGDWYGWFVLRKVNFSLARLFLYLIKKYHGRLQTKTKADLSARLSFERRADFSRRRRPV